MDQSQPQPAPPERPGIYLRFEMGVSWNPRHTPKSRQVTYMSRSMRRRSTQFPRQLPPANTNFLAAPGHDAHPQHQQQNQYPSHSQQQYQQHLLAQQAQQASYPYQPQGQYQNQGQDQYPYHQNQYPAHHHQSANHYPLPSQQPNQQPQSRDMRGSRSRSRSSHERGRSAPPPLNDSPWDAEPEPMMATALPRRKPGPQVWKALPATPAQYRLGEDNMPWSPSLYPVGYVEDDEVESIAGPSNSRAVGISPHQFDDRERGRATEIESLGAALMTVDNGFEDQWWYQGPRLVNLAGDLISTAAMRDLIANGGTVGWAVADGNPSVAATSRDSFPAVRSPHSSRIDIVSPVSDFPSPVSSFHGLRRSMTTRSDELHM